MSTYFQDGNLVEGVNSTVSSGGTLALVASSKTYQRITGTQNHTVTLPDATTLKNIGRRFSIRNRSTGTVTVNNFSGSLIATLAANTQRDFVVSDVSSQAGVWELAGDSGSGGGGNASVQSSDTLKMMQGLAGLNYSDGSNVSKVIAYNPEDVGADVWTNKSVLNTARGWANGFVLNGYAYDVSGLGTGDSYLTSTERFDDTANYWLLRGNINTSRNGSAIFSLNGFGYAASGSTQANSYSTSTEKYNDATDTWSNTAAVVNIGSSSTFGVAIGGYGFLAYGNNAANTDTNRAEAFSDANVAWYSRASSGFQTRNYPSAFVLNDFAYYVAGFSYAAGNTVSNADKYNFVSNSWQAISNYLTNTHSGATFVANGLAYYAGGDNVISTVGQYLDAGNSWVSKKSLTTARKLVCGFGLNGMGYAAGGYDGANRLTSTEQYKNFNYMNLGKVLSSIIIPSSVLVAAATYKLADTIPVQVRTDGDNWKPMVANSDSALKLNETLKNKFYEYGLAYSATGYTGAASNANEVYNPVQNTWTVRANVTSATYAPGSCALDSGAGYLFGGAGLTGNTQKYSDITNAWAAKTSMPADPGSGVGTFRLNGYGFITTGNNLLANSYRYDPSQDSFITRSAPNTTRCYSANYNIYELGYLATGNTNGSGATATNINERYNAETNSWTTLATTSTSRSGTTGFAVNGKGYVGGASQIITSSVEQYNPNTNSWSNTTSFAGGNFYDGGTMVSGGVGYIASWGAGGGFGGSTYNAGTYKWSEETASWTSVASLNTAKYSGSMGFTPGSYRNYEIRVGLPAYSAGVGSGVWTAKSNIVTAGADRPFSVDGTMFLNVGSATYMQTYNEAADVWFNSGLNFNTGTTSYGQGVRATRGFGYIEGGSNGGTFQSTSYKFDHTVKTWTQMTSMANARYVGSSFSLNSYGYAIGGLDNGASYPPLEQYNPVTNAWATKAQVGGAGGRNSSTANSALGFGYNIGGNGSGGGGYQQMDQYNDAANTWATVAAIPYGSGYNGSANLGDRIYVTGTALPANQAYTQVFNPASNVWYYGPNIPFSGQAPGATMLNGGIYLPGGYNGSTLSTNYRFNPSVKQSVIGIALEVK